MSRFWTYTGPKTFCFRLVAAATPTTRGALCRSWLRSRIDHTQQRVGVLSDSCICMQEKEIMRREREIKIGSITGWFNFLTQSLLRKAERASDGHAARPKNFYSQAHKLKRSSSGSQIHQDPSMLPAAMTYGNTEKTTGAF